MWFGTSNHFKLLPFTHLDYMTTSITHKKSNTCWKHHWSSWYHTLLLTRVRFITALFVILAYLDYSFRGFWTYPWLSTVLDGRTITPLINDAGRKIKENKRGCNSVWQQMGFTALHTTSSSKLCLSLCGSLFITLLYVFIHHLAHKKNLK